MGSQRIRFSYAKEHGVVVTSEDDATLNIAHLPDASIEAFMELKRRYNKSLVLEQVDPEQFDQLLSDIYHESTDHAVDAAEVEDSIDLTQFEQTIPSSEELLESDDDAPVIRFINSTLAQAIKQFASDVHFESFEEAFIVRYRIDGVMQKMVTVNNLLATLICSRLKVMARLDIAEKQVPQDGRMSLKLAGRMIDVRVSTIPTQYGERIVLRLLDKKSMPLDVMKLGMSDKVVEDMRSLIHQPHGILLVTGPTGSGKTTSLYSALIEINHTSRNIMTVEDPVEYYISGTGQTQVNPKVGMTFARGLRAILRQDPDVVMVGEIRDLETVNMAIRASLTGHLVISTLHTNSAIGAIARLRDMGAESYLLSSTMIGVSAQRLVRVLCPECKQAGHATEREKKMMDVDLNETVVVFRSKGCAECSNLGYKGRTGIYELIKIDDEIQKMIHNNASEATIEAYARQYFPTLRQDGWRLVKNGVTSIEEVLRITLSN